MSTNYYLINKKDKLIKQELDNLIESEIETIENILLNFNEKHDLNSEYQIVDKLRDVRNILDYGIFEPEEIHICKTSRILTWQINEYYKDENEFIDFYNSNKDNYIIQDEYREELTIDELLEKIHGYGEDIKYLSCEFS